MAIELKIVEMTLDELPYACPECGTGSFTLDGRGLFDALASVWGTCTNSHSWEEQLITIEDLAAINAARTGRQHAEDDDTFEIIIGGAVLAGTLHPELTVDEIKRAVRDVYWKRIIKPALRRRKNAAARAMKRPVKNGVAAAKAAAIGAAWDLQAGGHDLDPNYTPEPINRCPFCKDGYIDLDTHLHDTTEVPCSVCHGTGEID
jgi:hypothetical protein